VDDLQTNMAVDDGEISLSDVIDEERMCLCAVVCVSVLLCVSLCCCVSMSIYMCVCLCV